jgi:endo-1,4-beta-xylanase
VGAAINEAADHRNRRASATAIVATQFDSISPENALKWERIHPRPDTYTFELADKYVEFGEKNHMFIVGHNLVWHSQVPDWVFQDDQGKAADTRGVVEADARPYLYRGGALQGADSELGCGERSVERRWHLRQSKWLKIIGEDYIEKAFEYAHEADPQAELNYNDYSLENEPNAKARSH